MKQNLKNNNLIRRSSGWFALIAVLTLGVGVAAYNEVRQKINASERDLAMIDKLNELAHFQVLLGQISSGHEADARQILRMEIQEDLAEIRPLVAGSSHDATEYAQSVLAQIDRYQKAHPDYYLTSSSSAAPEKIKLVQTDRQVAASKMMSQ